MNVFLEILCKTEHLILIKKVVTPFAEKVPAYRKKRTDEPREEYISEEHFEGPITDTSKRTISLKTIRSILTLRNLKHTQSLRNVNRTLSLRTLRCFKTLNDFCAVENSFRLVG